MTRLTLFHLLVGGQLLLWGCCPTNALLMGRQTLAPKQQALLQATTRPNVYCDKTPSSKHIRQTDYLRNPRPKKKAQEESPVPKSENDSPPIHLLDEALLSFQSTAANAILQWVEGMRKKSVSREAMEHLVDQLLELGPDSKNLPFWSRLRPLSRYSKRARLASLRRTLTYSTPPPNDEEGEVDDPADQQRRRRRAFLSILRALSTTTEEEDGDAEDAAAGRRQPAIRILEKRARREQNMGRDSSKEDMTARRPADLETPQYSVVAQRKGYEIRRYQPFTVCSVSMNKPRPADKERTDAKLADPKMGSGASSFGALAGYLFGKNEPGQAMKMTTPVFTTTTLSGGQDDDGVQGGKQMSFVLPSEYWDAPPGGNGESQGLSLAPQPLDGSGVTLDRKDLGERAVLMFGGYASKANVEKRNKLLLESLAQDPEWEVNAGKEALSLAQYNDPFTPPWKRLNEVSVAVQPSTK